MKEEESDLSDSTEIEPRTKRKTKSSRGKKALFGWFLAFLVSIAVDVRLESLRGRSPSIERISISIPGYALISATSPIFLPCLAYPGSFLDTDAAKLEKDGHTLEEVAAKASGSEGVLWGFGQCFAFYLPFVLRFRRKETVGKSPSAAQASREPNPGSPEKSVLESAIEKCDQ